MKLKPVIPFEPILANQPVVAEDWVSQVKWDGVRMLSYYDGAEVRLINRNLNDRTLQYPEFLDPSSYCAASSFILDGEMIAFDRDKPSFSEMMRRDRMQKRENIEAAVREIPVTYMIFDILYCNSQWVTDQPLRKRQELLSRVLLPQPHIQPVQNVADAPILLELMKQRGMEGIVCKDLNSTYAINGKDRRWQKVKIYRDLIAVVGGVTFHGKMVNALLLGVCDQGKLKYIGHAGTGKLRAEDWRNLTERIQPLIIDENPFYNQPERSGAAVWVKPVIRVKVKFLEWTAKGTMRQPGIQAFVSG